MQVEPLVSLLSAALLLARPSRPGAAAARSMSENDAYLLKLAKSN